MPQDPTEITTDNSNLAEQLTAIMGLLAPEIPYEVAYGRLQNAGTQMSPLVLYQSAYLIVTGSV